MRAGRYYVCLKPVAARGRMSGRGPQAKRSGRDKLSKTAKGFRQHSISPLLPALPTLPCLPARRRHISPQIVSPNPLPARKRHNFAPFVSQNTFTPQKRHISAQIVSPSPIQPRKRHISTQIVSGGRRRGGRQPRGRGGGYAFAGAEALQRTPAGVRMQMRSGKAARRGAGAGRGR